MTETTTAERPKTGGDIGRLLRAIGWRISDDHRLPAPIHVKLDPEGGYAALRFPDGATASVDAWAVEAKAKPTHEAAEGERTPAHWYDTFRGGTGELVGWRVDLWCFAPPSATEPDEPAS